MSTTTPETTVSAETPPEGEVLTSAAFRQHPFTLAFRDAGMEQRFAEQTIRRSLETVRLSILFGGLIWALFGILDHVMGQDQRQSILSIRFFCLALFVLAYALTFKSWFYRVAPLLFAVSLVTLSAAIIIMGLVGPPQLQKTYYIGMILVVSYCATIIGSRFLYSLIGALLIFGLYALSILVIHPVLASDLIFNNLFFLGTATGFSMMASYAQERYIRRDFARDILLSQSLQKAEAASKAKSDFMAIISHELRTPLNAIIGFSDMMKQEMLGPLGSESYQSYCNDIYDSGTHLLAIINDILSISKFELGTLKIEDSVVDGHALIDSSLRLVQHNAHVKTITLAYDPPEETVYLLGDQSLMRQALLNIVNNAIKFTHTERGEVIVSAFVDQKGQFNLVVTDNGIGIPEEHLESILEPFGQVDTSLARQNEGIGLGLPLSHQIMHLHEGRLEITSTVDVGTKVALIFPKARTNPDNIQRDPHNEANESDDGADT